MKLVRLQCIKDFVMKDRTKTYTKGKTYTFVNKKDRYFGFDDEYNSIHKMNRSDLEGFFELDYIESFSFNKKTFK